VKPAGVPEPATIHNHFEDDLDDLRARLTLHDETVAIPGSNRILTITRPSDTDALLDQAAGDPEQNLPYWSELWPSGIALAAAILEQPDLVRSLPVLELGTGLGLTAIAALEAGADLIVTDYSPESLVLASANARRNTGREPRTVQMNWRDPDQALLDEFPDGFPVVLAADVLYERRDIQPLLSLFDRLVALGGLLWLAEPGRPPASIFLETASRQGWTFDTTTSRGPWPDPKDEDVIARVHQMRRRGQITP
jgi:predicted nicotinamide N-methyase